MKEQELTVIAKIRIKKDNIQEAREGLKKLAAETRKEPGCITYVPHQCVDDETAIVFYERWKQKSDVDKHFESPHFKAWQKISEKWMVEPPEVTFLKIIA